MAEEKSRHGCLLAWLILIIILNSTSALFYLLYILGRRIIIDQISQVPLTQSQILQIQSVLNIPIWVISLLVGLSIFGVVCAIALLLWRKWGFWGYLGTTVASLTISLIFFSGGIGTITYSVISGIAGVLILFGVLHIGKENKGWTQLK